MIFFVECDGGWLFAGGCDRPSSQQGPVGTVVRLDGILATNYDEHAGAGFLHDHAFDVFRVNFDFADYFIRFRVDDADESVRQLGILAAIYDIKQFGRGIIPAGVRAFLELDAARRFEGGTVVDTNLPKVSVHYVEFFRLVPVQEGMRRLEVGDGVNQFVGLEIEDQDFGILFGGGEQPVARQVRVEMIEVSIFELRYRSGLRQF